MRPPAPPTPINKAGASPRHKPFLSQSLHSMSKTVVVVSAVAIALMSLGFQAQAQNEGKLALPVPEECAKRVKHASFNGHSYFFSWDFGVTRDINVTWFQARNICRRHCMDTVSIETDAENAFLIGALVASGKRFMWTSGRKCNFNADCQRADLQPTIVNGWFWSGSGERLPPTSDRTQGHWSPTGGAGQPQPDNRELAINGEDEACLAVMNNFYSDGVKWHDIACYHEKPFVCEDSDELLNYVRATNPGLAL